MQAHDSLGLLSKEWQDVRKLAYFEIRFLVSKSWAMCPVRSCLHSDSSHPSYVPQSDLVSEIRADQCCLLWFDAEPFCDLAQDGRGECFGPSLFRYRDGVEHVFQSKLDEFLPLLDRSTLGRDAELVSSVSESQERGNSARERRQEDRARCAVSDYACRYDLGIPFEAEPFQQSVSVSALSYRRGPLSEGLLSRFVSVR